jgi:hypothetical protein
MNRQEVLHIAEGMGDFTPHFWYEGMGDFALHFWYKGMGDFALHFWYDVVGDFAPQFWHDGMGDLARFWYSSRRSRHLHGLKAPCLKNCFLIWTPPVFWAEDGWEVVHEHGRRMLKRTWLLECWLVDGWGSTAAE